MNAASVSIGSAGIVQAEKGKKGVGILDGGCFYVVALPAVISLALFVSAVLR